jgi:hypothetical protein
LVNHSQNHHHHHHHHHDARSKVTRRWKVGFFFLWFWANFPPHARNARESRLINSCTSRVRCLWETQIFHHAKISSFSKILI